MRPRERARFAQVDPYAPRVVEDVRDAGVGIVVYPGPRHAPYRPGGRVAPRESGVSDGRPRPPRHGRVAGPGRPVVEFGRTPTGTRTRAFEWFIVRRGR